MKPRITLVTLGVDDLERSLAFYREGLGFASEGIVGKQFEHGAVAFFELESGLRMALWPRASIAHDTGVPRQPASTTEFTLGHNVESREEVDAAMARAKKAGARIVKEAADTFWGGYAGYFADPDGHLWEVAWNPQWGRDAATTNRERLTAIFAALAQGDSRPFVDALADDVRWEVTGTSRWSRTYEGKRSVMGDFLGPITEQFATRYRNSARRMTAEGDRVVVECRGEVTTKAGKPYNNQYCWVFRLEGGRIREVTEYMDTKLAESALK
jgi:ketosteroid isomerase-like protein/catechol 2,3-dioxygenase-like lactoylglutathione lyase family enzyme